MTLAYLKIGGGERWPITLALTALSWISFYGLFDYTLKVPFPDGLLLRWLVI
jgi:hypothetical protein